MHYLNYVVPILLTIICLFLTIKNSFKCYSIKNMNQLEPLLNMTISYPINNIKLYSQESNIYISYISRLYKISSENYTFISYINKDEHCIIFNNILAILSSTAISFLNLDTREFIIPGIRFQRTPEGEDDEFITKYIEGEGYAIIETRYAFENHDRNLYILDIKNLTLEPIIKNIGRGSYMIDSLNGLAIIITNKCDHERFKNHAALQLLYVPDMDFNLMVGEYKFIKTPENFIILVSKDKVLVGNHVLGFPSKMFISYKYSLIISEYLDVWNFEGEKQNTIFIPENIKYCIDLINDKLYCLSRDENSILIYDLSSNISSKIKINEEEPLSNNNLFEIEKKRYHFKSLQNINGRYIALLLTKKYDNNILIKVY